MRDINPHCSPENGSQGSRVASMDAGPAASASADQPVALRQRTRAIPQIFLLFWSLFRLSNDHISLVRPTRGFLREDFSDGRSRKKLRFGRAERLSSGVVSCVMPFQPTPRSCSMPCLAAAERRKIIRVVRRKFLSLVRASNYRLGRRAASEIGTRRCNL
jgi:hypothetical protein